MTSTMRAATPGESDVAEHAGEESLSDAAQPILANAGRGRNPISRKVLAVVIILIIIGVSITAIWATYFAARSIETIAGYVINDPTASSPGFKHSLAGETMTVKGKVSNITSITTSLGDMSIVWLDDFEDMGLVFWDESTYEVGQNIRTKIAFEWSVCNNESHVYSPNLSFPVLGVLPSLGEVIEDVAAVGGTFLTVDSETNETLVLEVFDQIPEWPLGGVNCSLRAGQRSWAAEYVDVLGIGTPEFDYGRELGFLPNLTQTPSDGAKISFVDADLDGNLSRHDRFVLRGLARPDQASGAYTYALVLGIDPALGTPIGRTVGEIAVEYIVMTRDGVLKYEDVGAPYGRIENDFATSTDAGFTFVRMESPVSWDDVEIQFTDGTNYDSWHPDASALDNGSTSTVDLSLITMYGLRLTCLVKDVAGNGIVDEGDSFEVRAEDGTSFASGQTYSVNVLHEPSMERMGNSSFEP